MVDAFRKNAMAAKPTDIFGTRNASHSGDILGEAPLLESLVFLPISQTSQKMTTEFQLFQYV
jgi:hypothetical protein